MVLGYKGRLGIYETIEMIPEMQKKIQEPGVTAYRYRARSDQARHRDHDSRRHPQGAWTGRRSVEEVFRVVD
jgi:type II secretory ATPase GspE/PulE/Tfp pilus assembly ATPase PilB-like protein